MSGEPFITKRTSKWRPVLLTTGLLLLGGLAVCAIDKPGRLGPAKPTALVAQHPDPRLTYTGPYRNVRPDVAYVGDAPCAGCHEAIAKSFARHPMGRSLVPVADLLDQKDDSATPIIPSPRWADVFSWIERTTPCGIGRPPLTTEQAGYRAGSTSELGDRLRRERAFLPDGARRLPVSNAD